MLILYQTTAVLCSIEFQLDEIFVSFQTRDFMVSISSAAGAKALALCVICVVVDANYVTSTRKPPFTAWRAL